MHAIAYQHVTEVHEEPSRTSRVVGYLRRGTRFRVKPRGSRRGCERGWHESKLGGWVCDGRGVLVGTEPVDFQPSPAPARLDAALPYAYGSVMSDGTLSFYRIPTREEEAAAEAATLRARLPTVEQALETTDEQATATAAPVEGAPEAAREAEVSSGETPPPPSAEAATDPESSAERAAESAAAEAKPEEARRLPELVEAVLLDGFFLSIDGRVTDAGRTFYRTVRNRFVRADRVIPARAPTFHGVRLSEARNLPVAFLARAGVDSLRRAAGDRLVRASRLKRLTTFFPAGDADGSLLNLNDGTVVRSENAVLVRRREPPRGLREGEKWIDVDLAAQTLVAYEGTTPVYATLVASGRAGFETPTGTYRIQSKHVTATMDDPTSPDEAYSIEDVPWTMYLKDSLALHGAFWHRSFGGVRSHGCVNLSPPDARWLFGWSDPPVTEGFHGVIAGAGAGTRVVIH